MPSLRTALDTERVHLSVYQQFSESDGEPVPAYLEVEGRITPLNPLVSLRIFGVSGVSLPSGKGPPLIRCPASGPTSIPPAVTAFPSSDLHYCLGLRIIKLYFTILTNVHPSGAHRVPTEGGPVVCCGHSHRTAPVRQNHPPPTRLSSAFVPPPLKSRLPAPLAR